MFRCWARVKEKESEHVYEEVKNGTQDCVNASGSLAESVAKRLVLYRQELSTSTQISIYLLF